jgi:hypothetical protein
MKPIERIAAIADAAREPVMVVTTNPLADPPDTYTLRTEDFGRLLKLAADAGWAAAFIERLRVEAAEAAAFAERQRDDTYPVHPDNVNHEAGEEPGPADPWSQGFHEGAAHVVDMLGQLIHTDPELFAPDDTAFRVAEPGVPLLQTARATVLEFDPEPEGQR